MPLSALPPGFDNKQKGDWNFWPFYYIKPSLTAFGPLAIEWWAKWRRYPITLFAMFGPGESRWESNKSEFRLRAVGATIWFFKPTFVYLSAIQYWCDWHIQIGWPLFFAFHFTYKRKVFYFRIGARRNADEFYDFPSAHCGDWN